MARWNSICVVLVLAADALPAQTPPQPAGPATTPPPAVTAGNPPLAAIPPLSDAAPQIEAPVAFVMPPAQSPGFFATVDFSILVPHVKSDLRGSVPITSNVFMIDTVPALFAPNYPTTITLPFAAQDATLAPKFVAGWRFADNFGAIQATYRLVASEGSSRYPTFDWSGDAVLQSRLDINEIGLSYATLEHPLGALWSLRWEFGARLATIFFDSQAYGPWLGQTNSNDFVGAGPQAALNITREFSDSGFALFSRVDAADYIGRIQQKFTDRRGDTSSPYAYGYAEQDGSQAVPYVGVQAGLSWLSYFGNYRVTMGYEFNQWWNVARLGDSRGWIQAQGAFLRTEFNY